MKVTIKIERVKEVPFQVRAKTYDEAQAFFDRRGSAACYEANPSYKFGFDDAKNVDSIAIVSKPTIAFPNWSLASKLKGQEKKNWDAMIKALRKHEDGHVAIFDADARAFKAAREKEGGFPKKEIDKVMAEFFGDSQKNQDKYDTRTGHGAKEGVELPPAN